MNKVFKYKVLPESAQLSAVMQLKSNNSISTLRQSGMNQVLFTETDEGQLVVKNLSKTLWIRNIFVFCSHPIVFGFQSQPLLSKDGSGDMAELGPEDQHHITVPFKASLQGIINVKFLFRYEAYDPIAEAADVKPLIDTSRFRF